MIHLLGLLAVAVCAAGSGSFPVVDLGYAKFRGSTSPGWRTTTYFGLRYAAPPVGDLRFRGPRPIEDGDYYDNATIADATERSSPCIQGIPGFRVRPHTPRMEGGREDCLLVDVYVPAEPVNASLPVLVSMHGGGYVHGGAAATRGFALVKQSQSIVYLSIQYRLGALGFLNSQEVVADGDANAGLLDQRSALQWVRRNIHHFGGDPSRVTIMGDSAGGGSVMNQMILYGGQPDPPFRAAISQFPWWLPYNNHTVVQRQYCDFLAAANCTNLACLRNASSATLDLASQAAVNLAYSQHRIAYGMGYWGPSVDGRYVMDLPSRELSQGRFTKIPLLTGHEEYEGYIFSNPSETTAQAERTDLRLVFPTARSTFFSRLLQLYPRAGFNSTFWQRQQIFGDLMINCPTYYLANAFSNHQLPTWKMVFDAGTMVHNSIDPYVYGDPSDRADAILGQKMKDWISSFVIHLDPNVQSFTNTQKLYWPRYRTSASQNTTVINVQIADMSLRKDSDDSARCQFLFGQTAMMGMS
ncbi:hypothetical protein ANO11243_080830 [Dothideomycetidae sp. 11243]|nr:hypothetical protein ANO11243_080830 [fungal sp. No.11243]